MVFIIHHLKNQLPSDFLLIITIHYIHHWLHVIIHTALCVSDMSVNESDTSDSLSGSFTRDICPWPVWMGHVTCAYECEWVRYEWLIHTRHHIRSEWYSSLDEIWMSTCTQWLRVSDMSDSFTRDICPWPVWMGHVTCASHMEMSCHANEWPCEMSDDIHITYAISDMSDSCIRDIIIHMWHRCFHHSYGTSMWKHRCEWVHVINDETSCGWVTSHVNLTCWDVPYEWWHRCPIWLMNTLYFWCHSHLCTHSYGTSYSFIWDIVIIHIIHRCNHSYGTSKSDTLSDAINACEWVTSHVNLTWEWVVMQTSGHVRNCGFRYEWLIHTRHMPLTRVNESRHMCISHGNELSCKRVAMWDVPYEW